MAHDPAIDASPPVQLPDRIAHAAGLAGAATLASRLLGLVREQVLAALFGAGDQMDAYLVAFRIPNLVRDLFAEGAMSAAFVPTFTRHLTLHGRSDAWRLANNVLNALLLLTGLTVIVGYAYATPLVTAYAESFAAVPGKLELTIQLARVMFPFLVLVAIAAAFMGMLNSLRHYFIPALAPATFNVVAIICAFALTPLMPRFGYPPIMAMAFAVLIGGLTQVLVQWPALRSEGFRYAPRIDPRDEGLHRVLMLMGPGTVGLAATQVNLFVSTLLATSQGTGAVSWLQYAFRVMYLPLGLFGVSIATAVLPAAARHAATQDRRAVAETVHRGLALMLMVNIPATCGLVALADAIIRLLLERGHFTASDTAATAAALQLYAIGLVGYSTTRITSPVFYALGRSRVPVMLSAVSVTVNLTLSLVLARVMGFRGLALATSMAALVNAALCLLMLRLQLDGIGGRRLAIAFVKVAVASAVMSVVVIAVHRSLGGFAMRGTAPQVIALVAAIGSGVATLGVAARLLRVEEFAMLVSDARRRVQKLLSR
ncbi:MAG TPA: murein biosynthesis integral membrane protein MurJ [Vicinamibacterales bacterium]|nr:murein biosynthesis integral membrane protein MurJ [Vicinamibacterales bacterium]